MPMCARAFDSPKEVVLDMRRAHATCSFFKCPYDLCFQSFAKLYNLQRHINRCQIGRQTDEELPADDGSGVPCTFPTSNDVTETFPVATRTGFPFKERAASFVAQMHSARLPYTTIMEQTASVKDLVRDLAGYFRSKVEQVLLSRDGETSLSGSSILEDLSQAKSMFDPVATCLSSKEDAH